MDKVGIVATSQTKYEPDKKSVSIPEMVYSVVKPLLKELDIKIFDIDHAVTCSSDFWDGKTISNLSINEVVGAYLRPETKVASDGSQALFYAMIRILSGEYESALVVAHCKMSQGYRNQIDWGAGDPFFMRPVGVDDLNAAAMQARAYMNAYGISEEQCAAVSVKNKGNALKNPHAQDGRSTSVRDVMHSAYLSSPIKELDRSPAGDGACALILANERKAKEWTETPVWIAGAGTANDLFYFGDRNLKELSSLTEAARKAYGMAGIQAPGKEIHVAEISESYSYLEPMIYEGLGLCDPGEGIRLLESGVTAMNGDLPVNPSGGMLGGCPEIVGGLNAAIEVARQLAGNAGDHQVDGPKVGLVHGKNGFAAQQNTVIILKNSL